MSQSDDSAYIAEQIALIRRAQAESEEWRAEVRAMTSPRERPVITALVVGAVAGAGAALTAAFVAGLHP